MQFIVADIECFHDDIIKELAFANPYFSLAFCFAPPTPLSAVQPAKQKMNNWLTRNLHGITWESGVMPFNSLGEITAVFDNPNIKIYVKGLQKINILKKYFTKAMFIDMETLQCPKYTELIQFPRFVETTCSNYPQTHNSATYSGHCAQRKASMYCQWLMFVNRLC